MSKKLSAFLFMMFSALLPFANGQVRQFSHLDVSNGLSNNQVNAILKDKIGFMWFGTMSGLNRYDGHQFKIFKNIATDSTSISDDFIIDIFELPEHKLYVSTRNGANIYSPESQTFNRNVKAYLASLGIPTSSVKEVIKDNDGNFWFNAASEGLYKYELASGKTRHLACITKSTGVLSAAPVSAIKTDLQGRIWVIHTNKTIEKIDQRTLSLVQRYSLLTLKKEDDYRLFLDNSGDVWVYLYNSQHGLDYFQPSTNKRKYISNSAGALNSDLITGIVQDEGNRIWIATDHGGINLIDKSNFVITYLQNRQDDPKSLGQNSIVSLYKDPTGITWIGTFKEGVSYYHKSIIKFPIYNHQAAAPNHLPYNDVNRFAEDAKGNIWIGTNGGGLLCLNRKTGAFKRYIHNPLNKNSLSNDIIVSLYIDHEQKLWIGGYFGGLDCFDGTNFKNYKHQDGQPGSLADDRVWDILEDQDHQLWVATLGGGLDLLNRATGEFTHHQAYKVNGIGSNYVSRVIEDRSGNLWIGTANGLDKLEKRTKRFIHFQHETGNSQSLSNNNIYDLLEDSYGFIWVATRGGLSRHNPRSGTFRNFDAMDGLSENASMKILEDDKRNLWVSTANGLFCLIVSSKYPRDFEYSFRKYDKQDGLQDNAFNAGAAFRLRSGELIFGGANGFNLFQPATIKSDNSVPRLIFSDLRVANNIVKIREKIGGEVLLSEALDFNKSLRFHHQFNAFTIEFSALNFFNPDKIRYQYKLEGFDKHWQEPQPGIRTATYTNLDAGDYVFRVRSTNAAGNWVNNIKTLDIKILPPFWRSPWAYLFYVLLSGGTLLYIRHLGIRKLRQEFSLEEERQQARRNHELDVLKIKFFTNVSHEFRTPLSLIISPLDKLIRQAKEQDQLPLMMIQRNGRRLLNLVNQLLDFRSMEVREHQLHPTTGDIVKFIKDLSFSFADEAEKKHISFSFHSNNNSLITRFDHDKVERILFNLLSNAFKFTPEGGAVEVMMEQNRNEVQQSVLILKVCDTGIGIIPGKEQQIFERFFQNEMPDSIVNQGSGIGLSIAREFVKLHQGDISVQHREGGGSIFLVKLMLPEVHPPATTSLIEDSLIISETKITESWISAQHTEAKKQVLLLVEDNEDFRCYLKDNLREYYHIAEAADGLSGWQKVLSVQPDLVVSDVSMPGLSGIDLCRKIKADRRTAAIPVVLLTALAAEENQLEGLETGASDYMTKPFSFEILLSKIRNLLSQQKLSKQTYRKQLDVNQVVSEIESVDEKFMRLVSKFMEIHVADSTYSVDRLSTDLNMSRVGLYKKLRLLTGKSPVAYMRSYRLKKAIPLLEKSQLTISEVAYEVGFNNPKQFSIYFKEEFGVLPSAYSSQSGNKG